MGKQKKVKKEKTWTMTVVEMCVYLTIGAIALYASGKIEALLLLGLIVASDLGMLALIYFEWYGVVHCENVKEDIANGEEPESIIEGVMSCLTDGSKNKD